MRRLWLAAGLMAGLGCGSESTAIQRDDAPDEAVISEGSLTGEWPVGSTLETTGNVHLRSGASSSTTSLAVLPLGTRVISTQARPTNAYYAVDAQGRRGWVSGRYLKFISAPVVDAGTPTPTASPVVDLLADTNRSGAVELNDATENDGEETWSAAHGAVFLANLDDDTLRCRAGTNAQTDNQLALCNDAADEVVNGVDDQLDLAPLAVRAWPGAPDGTTAAVTTTQPSKVRLFKQAGSTITALPSSGVLSLAELRAGVSLFLEGKDVVRNAAQWNGLVDVKLTVTTPSGAQSDVVQLRVAPVVTFSHAESATTVFASNIPSDSASSAFQASLRRAVGATAGGSREVVTPTVGDQWAQDFFETAYMSVPGPNHTQRVMTVFMRSANLESRYSSSPLREAGRIVFTQFRGKDTAGLQQYDLNSPSDSQSLNSFGNLETVPPYEFNGTRYPFGRLLRGAISGFRPDTSFDLMLASQNVQPVIELDTSWLLVGHVDETMSFLKVPSSPRGWVLLVNDARLARSMLQQAVAQGAGNTPLFVGQYWLDDTNSETAATRTISQVLADNDVMTASNEAAVKVDAQLAKLKRETGLTDAEIVRVPFLHQPVSGGSLAYNPGTVNMLVLDDHNVIVPDPHGPIVNSVDLFKQQLEQALAPFQVRVQWVDDWNLYHRLAGEIHCGTNAVRTTPAQKWWEVQP